MTIKLKTDLDVLHLHLRRMAAQGRGEQITVDSTFLDKVLVDAVSAHQLHALINNPHTELFLEGVKLEAAHQRERWGEAHDRGKSAENWFWLVGYLAGKCLRAVITGDKTKALHHTISSAAALANWYEAIGRDDTGAGLGHDKDIRPVEVARFEGGGVPVVKLSQDMYSGR